MKMQTITSLQEFLKYRSSIGESKQVGFVPTMGYLHKGHISLVRKAHEENDKVYVSIFVNPTQFGPNEDLSKYPTDMKRDLKLLEKEGVDVVFTPTKTEMYPDGFSTYVEPTGLVASEVEGASRPGHFRGVATVVLKLFTMVAPDNAYFGQKDAQQAIIVSNLIKDLNLPITLHVLPTVREKDGLAMSSRNNYLDSRQRKAATILYKALQKGKETLDANVNKEPYLVLDAIKETLETEPLAKVDYIELRHPVTFEKLTKMTAPALLLVAARIGQARLIDNFYMKENNEWNTGVIA